MARTMGEGESDGGGERWSVANWLFIGVFTVLTLLGVVISTGGLARWMLAVPAETGSPATVSVPPYVYLYASLGALGYVFTKLMTRLDRYDEWGEIEHLAQMGLRIPAAWVLAAGIYLLFTGTVPGQSSTPAVSAGVAFLVGLYVNVALKSLGGFADRILGRKTG